MEEDTKANDSFEVEFVDGCEPKIIESPTDETNENDDIIDPERESTACIDINDDQDSQPCFPPWTQLTEGFLHHWTRRFVVTLSASAAKHPKTWVASVGFISFALAAIGLATNFVTEFDQRAFLTPQGSLPDIHSDWINDESGFQKIRVFWAALHTNGDNVLTAQAMRQAFGTFEAIRAAPDFENVCSQSEYLDYHTHQPTCRIFSVTQFWNHNRTWLEEKLGEFNSEIEQDAYVRRVLSNNTFPDETPVFHEAILGNYRNETVDEALDNLQIDTTRVNGEDGQLHVYISTRPSVTQQGWFIDSAQALVFKLDLPDLGAETDKLEEQLMNQLGNLRSQYSDRPVQLEYFTLNAYQQEFQRAMNQDMPLVFVLGVIMVSFVCFVFWRRKEKVQSRSLLGIYSFVTIGMSLLSGYGIMFLAGVPLTSVGIMIPFVIVGVGLDDTFIITGAYFRLQRERQLQQQHTSSSDEDTLAIIEKTMDEVGVSISMTTWTTLLCFLLGSICSIPAVHWLCLYAATTIVVDFLYQITFFIALLVLDERRVQANRRDICFWIVVPKEGEEEEDDNQNSSEAHQETAGETSDDKEDGSIETPSSATEEHQSRNDVTGKILRFKEEGTSVSEETVGREDPRPLDRNFMERFMSWYADQLLRPWVKVVVLLVFSAYFVGCAYSTTLLRQEFNVGDYVPADSMLTAFTQVFQEYTSIQRFIGVYFRNVDQSDPYIQDQMAQYVQELADLPQIGEPPVFFWVRDFQQIAESEQAAELGIDVTSMKFNEQIDLALNIPPIRQIYAQDIVRDKSGNITASRTFLYLRQVDMADIQDQMDTLREQREITKAQPLNSPELLKDGELSFFAFDDFFYFWELYSIVVDELIFTTVCCVVVVSLVSFVFIPHWSAVLFVLPLIIMLYFMLLGTMQYCGLRIHSITYFIIVMAIGLLVDFLMHVLLRYYETRGTTRHAKVKETLETMGASILLGGFTTWLGVIPLAFSTTKTFMTVFISFLAMVTLGCSVGLALLPVLLSLVGPVDDVDTTPTTASVKASTRTESTASCRKAPIVEVSTPDVERVAFIQTETHAEHMRFTLTKEERDAVVALKKACEDETVKFRSIFELAKYVLVVRSLVSDSATDANQKRTHLALQRLKKRRKWEAYYGMGEIDPMEALKEIDEAAPGFFVVRYAADQERHNIVGHHIAYAPYDFMFASKENLGKYLVAEQWRLDLGAADLEEARKGIAVVSIADGLWGLAGAYRYLRVLTKANDNVADMHPNRVRKVYYEIPVFGHRFIESGKKLVPKKIADRVTVDHLIDHLEKKLCKAQEGTDPMTIVDWCERRNAVYQESVERVTL